MKRITLLFMLLCSVCFAQEEGYTTDLYFSMYAEGSENNHFVEIYNGTGEDVDLSAYKLETYVEDSPYPENTHEFQAGDVLPDGEVLVIYHPDADDAIVAAGDIASPVATFDGNDPIVLVKNDEILDIIGEIGEYIGSGGWAVAGVADGTHDHTLVRKPTICSPNSNPGGSFGTDGGTSEWIVYDQDEQWEALGSHYHEGCDGMSISENEVNTFVMHPNPNATGIVNFQGLESSDAAITIYDVLGKEVKAAALHENQMDVSNLNSGIYLVRVSVNGASETKKLIVR